MITVTMLLASNRPPFRKLWEGALPAVPDVNEPIAFNDRIYRVIERSWRFGTQQQAASTLQPITDERVVMAVGLLLEQIGGPAHVLEAPAGPVLVK